MRVRLVAGHAPYFFTSANNKERTVAPLLKGIAPLKKFTNCQSVPP
jgi:hypothetical protein